MTSAALPERPTSPEALAGILAEASAAGAQVQLIGSGSMSGAALAPAWPIRAVSTLRMNALVAHDAATLVVTARAGMSLGDLQRHLGWHNQWLPVDPPACNGRMGMQRTLGGLIATDSLGPLRAGFGDWHVHLLGARYIDSTGNIAAAGARDLIGSAGRAGAIAEVTLRTAPRPADEQCALFYCPTEFHAACLVAGVMAPGSAPAYVQLIGGETFAHNSLSLPAPPRGFQLLAVGFLGEAEACAANVAALRALPAARDLESIPLHAAQAGRLRLWMTSEPLAAASFRLRLRADQVPAAISAIEQLADHNRIRVFLVAEASTAVIRGSMHTASTPAIAALRLLAAALHAELQIVALDPPAGTSL